MALPSTSAIEATHSTLQTRPVQPSPTSGVFMSREERGRMVYPFRLDGTLQLTGNGNIIETTRSINNSTGRGILIGMLSALGSAVLLAIFLSIVYFLRFTSRGRILLDNIRRPGEFDDEQAFVRDEAEALDEMDDIQRVEYMRAKAFVQGNPPESVQTDISLSQFLAIQEKGVSAWEFEPELEIANCFVEGRTEIEFYDSVCSVQSNLPVPKQNEVYYWEAKIYDKPEATTVGIGMTTKPYPLFRLPGYHKTSVAYLSPGHRRFNQPFSPTASYGPPYVRGDVIGVGYKPRTGTVFFTRNGKKLDDITHTLKTQNLFPTIGATGPCSVHVNFGQMGFVYIEANVKKWGLAPTTGSLAPPPPYGSEAGSILLEGGHKGVREGQAFSGTPSSQHVMARSASGSGSWQNRLAVSGHNRSRSSQYRLGRQAPTSPGPERSPTDISLNQLSLVDFNEAVDTHEEDAGEGTSANAGTVHSTVLPQEIAASIDTAQPATGGPEVLSYAGNTADAEQNSLHLPEPPPPEYSSPRPEEHGGDDPFGFGGRVQRYSGASPSANPDSLRGGESRTARFEDEDDSMSHQSASDDEHDSDSEPDRDVTPSSRLLSSPPPRTTSLISTQQRSQSRGVSDPPSPPIPTYEAAMGGGESQREANERPR